VTLVTSYEGIKIQLRSIHGREAHEPVENIRVRIAVVLSAPSCTVDFLIPLLDATFQMEISALKPALLHGITRIPHHILWPLSH
jgi:hypothetical protein